MKDFRLKTVNFPQILSILELAMSSNRSTAENSILF